MQSGCPCGVCSASLGKCSIPGDRSQGDSTHSQMGLLCSVFLGKESGLGRGRSLAATWAQQQPQPPPGGVCTEMAQQNHPKLGQKGQAFRPPFAAGFPIPICSGHRVQAAPGRAQSRQRQHLQLRISWKGLTAESCPDRIPVWGSGQHISVSISGGFLYMVSSYRGANKIAVFRL